MIKVSIPGGLCPLGSGRKNTHTPRESAMTRPAAPIPPAEPLGLLAGVKTLLDNPLAAISARAYEAPMLEINRLRRPLLLVNHPAAIEHILLTNAENYRKSEQQRRRLEPALGEGLLTAEGDAWKRARRITAPLFTPKAIASLSEIMQSAASYMVDRWIVRSEPGRPLDLVVEFDRLTLDIAVRAMLSRDSLPEQTELLRSVATYMETIGRIDLASILGLPEWIPTLNRLRAEPALRSIRRIIASLLHEAETRTGRANVDLLDRLINARDPATAAPLSRKETADHLLTFLAAGFETTSNGLCWLFYLLALHPEAARQVRDELGQVLKGTPVTREHMDRLPSTLAVINETLRLYPPAPFIGREALGDDEICGQTIKAGAQILISPWIVHRHRSLWSRPEAFRPERFMDGRRDNLQKGAFIPFGLGPRICIGQGFAMMEIVTALAEILPHFDLKLDPQAKIVPQAYVTLRPRHGMKVIVTPS